MTTSDHPDRVYHITFKTDWDAALEKGVYTADSLAGDGFIHASTAAQVIATANRYYPGQTGLVLLEIECRKVPAEIRYENLIGGTELFPHIYGPLNLDAVASVTPLEPGLDGLFHELSR
jgi:uncharacterized protein (DUF952 family)